MDSFEKKVKEEFDKLDRDYDGLKLILDNTKDSYVCDCERNYGKACKYPDRYKNEGCND